MEARLWQGLQDRDFLLLGLADQDVERVVAFGRKTGATFPLLLDHTTYGQYARPSGSNYALEIVLDDEGVVRFARRGSTTDTLLEAVEDLL